MSPVNAGATCSTCIAMRLLHAWAPPLAPLAAARRRSVSRARRGCNPWRALDHAAMAAWHTALQRGTGGATDRGAPVFGAAQMTRVAPLCRITLGGRAAWACSSHRACFGSPARVRVRHCHWRQLRWRPALALNDFSFRNFGLLFICRPQASWAEGTRPKDRRFINMQTRGSGTRDLLEASKPLSRLAAVDLCEVLRPPDQHKGRCLSLRIVLPQRGN